MNIIVEKKAFEENFTANNNVLLLIGHLRTIKYLIEYHKKFLKKLNQI